MKSYPAYRDFGVCAWWVWNGNMRKPFMLKQLDKMKAAGIDEFCLYCERGCSLDFLEKSWFDMVAWVIPEVKKAPVKPVVVPVPVGGDALTPKPITMDEIERYEQSVMQEVEYVPQVKKEEPKKLNFWQRIRKKK